MAHAPLNPLLDQARAFAAGNADDQNIFVVAERGEQDTKAYISSIEAELSQLREQNEALKKGQALPKWQKLMIDSFDRFRAFEPHHSMDEESITTLFCTLAAIVPRNEQYETVVGIIDDRECWSKWLCVEALIAGGKEQCGRACGHKVQVYARPDGDTGVAIDVLKARLKRA